MGFPSWGMQSGRRSDTSAHQKLLSQFDLSGKTVVPFNTNAGYGIGSSFDTVKALCPNRKVLEGFSTKGGMERDGILFVMEGEKARKVAIEAQRWLQKIERIK